jgi:PAS domain S-box-containing protein
MKHNTGSGLLDDLNIDSGQMLLQQLASFIETSSRAAALRPATGQHAGTPDLQDRYRALVEQIPAVVFMAHLDGGLGEAYVSPQIEESLGFSQEEWLEDPILWYSLIHPDDKIRWSAEAAQMLMTGGPLKSNYRVIARDGRVVWFHCEVKMMRTADGHPWFIHGVGFDISGLKQTEEVLEEERDFITAILDTAAAVVVVLDSEDRITRFNRACEQTTGYSLDEVRNRYVWDVFMASDESQEFQAKLRQTRMGQKKYEHEAHWITRQGERRLFAWSGTILPGRHGKPSFTILTGIDITERKRLEKRELERQAAKTDETFDLLQQLINSMSEALLLVDVPGRVIRVNRTAGTLFKRQEKEMLGMRLSDLFSHPDIPSTPWQLCRQEPSGSLYRDTEIHLAPGSSFPAGVSCVLVRDKRGKITGLLLVIRDITERKQAEEALRQTEKLAATGRLAASIAHEINNPLEAVTNLLYLMKTRPTRSTQYLELANQELNRVIHIAKQTLGFYRDTSLPATVNLAETLDSLLYLFARRLESREIKVRKQYDDNEAEILAFGGEIRQVFSNLISNAVDAMPNGGTLSIRLSKGRAWKAPYMSGLRILVGDTGSGIAPEHRNKIFEAFHTTKIDIGTGLGLWITRSILEKHRGSIRFRSTISPGRSGTLFSVFLPDKGIELKQANVQRDAS